MAGPTRKTDKKKSVSGYGKGSVDAVMSVDAVAREALLLHASDWAFMVSRDSAAGYARDRHEGHLRAFRRLATGEPPATTQGATGAANVVVPHLDARVLADGLVAGDA